MKPKIYIIVLALFLSIILTILSAEITTTSEVPCFPNFAPPDCYEEVESAGFPFIMIPRGDVNSPAGTATWDDGYNIVPLLGNILFYSALLLLPYFFLLKRKNQ